jgi:hypothetical protein
VAIGATAFAADREWAAAIAAMRDDPDARLPHLPLPQIILPA